MMATEPVVAENGVETRSTTISEAANSTDAASSSPPNPNSFEEQYTLGKMIGSGTFSVVRDAIHKPTGQRYAIKCIKREGLVAEDIEALTTEVAILKQVGPLSSMLPCIHWTRVLTVLLVCVQMNHPNIMILHDFFAEEKYYYLVTEFMAGGELFDRIVEKVLLLLICCCPNELD